jgi:hypothetical protein
MLDVKKDERVDDCLFESEVVENEKENLKHLKVKNKRNIEERKEGLLKKIMLADCKVRLCNFEEYCEVLKEIIEEERIDVEKLQYL